MFLSNYEMIGSTDDFKTMGNSFLHKVVSILWHSEVTLSFESDKWTMRQFNNFLNSNWCSTRVDDKSNNISLVSAENCLKADSLF